jgi:hypothetical protein
MVKQPIAPGSLAQLDMTIDFKNKIISSARRHNAPQAKIPLGEKPY